MSVFEFSRVLDGRAGPRGSGRSALEEAALEEAALEEAALEEAALERRWKGVGTPSRLEGEGALETGGVRREGPFGGGEDRLEGARPLGGSKDR